jgi:hypothetical protein
VKELIDKIQALIDLHGDTWLALFTALVMVRIVLVVFKFAPITPSEAATYASCVTAFAATNIGKPKP